MGVRFPSVASNALIGIYGATGAETIVCTTPPLVLPLDSAQVIILWYVSFATGTGTTAVQPVIRRGTVLTAPRINGAANVVVTAALDAELSGWYIDTPGVASGVQYSLSLFATGTTGAATGRDQAIMAFVL